MQNYIVVEQVYNQMIVAGLISRVPYSSEQPTLVDDQKAFFTRRAAYYLNLKDSNIGLFAKTSGNNRLGLSVDCVYDKVNKILYDIATDDEGLVVPVDTDGATENDASRWVQPTKELAGLPVDEDPEAPPNDPPITNYELLVKDITSSVTPAVTSSVVSSLIPQFESLQSKLNSVLVQLELMQGQLNTLQTSVNNIKSCIFRR